MKKKIFVLLFLVFITAFSTTAFAHPGKTDGDGGHYNRSTGDYHYHHGYTEHYHTNGVCPYDYDDRTGENSGGRGATKGQKSNVENKITNNSVSSENTESEFIECLILIACAALSIFGFPLAVALITVPFFALSSIFKKIRENKKKEK